jgi:hypothetical protein
MSAVDPFMPKLVRRGLRPVSELAAARPHGHRLRYMAGCKCFKCRRSNSDYERQRQAARLAGDWNGIVDASRARRHLRYLSRAGVGQWSVCFATDIARSMIHEIKNGDRRRIRARTERKILAVSPSLRADGSLVPAVVAWHLIAKLLEEGFSKAGLAKLLGYRSSALQFNKKRITARNERRVIALHRRLTN